jgi:hypothetical protein
VEIKKFRELTIAGSMLQAKADISSSLLEHNRKSPNEQKVKIDRESGQGLEDSKDDQRNAVPVAQQEDCAGIKDRTYFEMHTWQVV